MREELKIALDIATELRRDIEKFRQFFGETEFWRKLDTQVEHICMILKDL